MSLPDLRGWVTHEAYPCDSRLTTTLTVAHTIPQLWTKWAGEAGTISVPLNTNWTDIIDPAWAITIPALSMKPARTLPFSMDDILGAPTYITVIATTITSVIMTIMVAICCLRKCGINLSRPREDVKHAMRAGE
uniref:Uncharacterized protein n=1 Tax=Cacopsylla melanoneura TaxID=428564 RepID=A0A8D8Q923_9HEMI